MKKTSFLVLALCCCFSSASAQTPPEDMVLVPAGEFTMGTSNSDRQGTNVPLDRDDARPQFKTTTKAFFLDKTEVTNAQYKKYCDATNYPTPPQWKNGSYATGEANFPVNYVSWYEAVAYANWLGKRLPTETEWEKAARGTDARRFPWGEGWDQSRVVWDTDGPRAVGQHPTGASPYGALDMAGNVFEWTADWFKAYPNAPPTERFTNFGENYKVVRGGAFLGGDSQAQTWFRSVDRPAARSLWIGFRCVQDVK